MRTNSTVSLLTYTGGIALAVAVSAGLVLAVAVSEGFVIKTASAHDEPRPVTELFTPGVAFATGAGDSVDAAGRPPLRDGLGDLSMPVTTTDSQAQAYFDQGLLLTWGFNHAEAWRSFRAAQDIDPNCPMCFWGEAFILGPNINAGMYDAAVPIAYAAITRAQALADTASPKEQMLIAALATRYGPEPVADRSELDNAWAEAMRAVADAYPDDANIQVLYADALMNLQPWDYWEPDGVTPRGAGGEIVARLEQALAADPHHLAGLHLYIHAVEASANPARGEQAADTLRDMDLGAGHLIHMPAHIYARIGRHGDSVAVNRVAVAADEAYLAEVGDAASPFYRFGYYPHNIHFLMVSAQMAGLGNDVIMSAQKLETLTSDDVSQQLAWVQAIKTAPYTAHAQFSPAETILALPDPGDRFPFVSGFWHYARGTAFAGAGDMTGAQDELAALVTLIETSDFSDLEAQYLPAADVLEVAKHVLEARIEIANGAYGAAEHHLHEAITLEDTIPYMEPPYWYYTVRQTMGAVLLMQGRADEAIDVFESALAAAPRNGWALWGLWQAQASISDPAAAETEAAFRAAWLGNADWLTLERL